MLCLLGANVRAELMEPEPFSLNERVTEWTRQARPPSAREVDRLTRSSRSDALSTLAGGLPSDARCAASLLNALHQNSHQLGRPTRAILEKATRPDSTRRQSWIPSPDGLFRVHYWTDPDSPDAVDPYDGDLDGLPDGVSRLASELTDVLADFVHVLNWPPLPAPERIPHQPVQQVVNVYLVGLPGSAGGLDGFTLPLGAAGTGPGETPEGSDSAIYVNSRLAGPENFSRAAVVHQVAHLVLNRESVHESPWWYEASAGWLQDRLDPTPAAVAARFGNLPSRRASGLDGDGLGLDLESSLWPHYLAQSTGAGADLLQCLWQEMAAVPGENTLDALDRVLHRRFDSSLAEEVRVFNIWNLFLGQADDGLHYTFGSYLPTPQGDSTYEVFPAKGGSVAGPVGPSGSAFVRMLGDGSRGGLRVQFSGDDGGAWDVSLIVHSANPPGLVRFLPLDTDSSGQAYVTFPWKNLAAVDLLIQNLADRTAPPADYSFFIDHDPAIPYDLLNFSVAESTAGALLSWSTETEERLAGWNIYRGPGPLGPFSRINEYLLPGAGVTDHPMSYIYLDTSVQSSAKYYYRLEGVTIDGFTEESHPAGVRFGRHRGR